MKTVRDSANRFHFFLSQRLSSFPLWFHSLRTDFFFPKPPRSWVRIPDPYYPKSSCIQVPCRRPTTPVVQRAAHQRTRDLSLSMFLLLVSTLFLLHGPRLILQRRLGTCSGEHAQASIPRTTPYCRPSHHRWHHPSILLVQCFSPFSQPAPFPTLPFRSHAFEWRWCEDCM